MIRRHATWMGVHPRSATFVSSLCFFFGEVFTRAYDTLLRTLLGPFGLAQLLGGSGHAGRVTLPWDPRFCPSSLGGGGRGATALPADGDGTPSLPFRSRGTRDPTMRSRQARPSLGFRPVAGTRCRFSPRDRVTKSRTRRCQRAILRSPSQFIPKGTRKSIPHSPAQRKRELWKLKFRARFGM